MTFFRRVCDANTFQCCSLLITLSTILVDAHTAQHLYQECLMGELMRGRTVILVSHHVMLVEPGADFIVALDNGRVMYSGDREGFRNSGVISTLLQSGATNNVDEEKKEAAHTIEEDMPPEEPEKEKDTHSAELTEGSGSGEGEITSSIPASEIESTAVGTEGGAVVAKIEKKKARKLVEDETRAVGRVSRDVWLTYVNACGSYWYWIVFALAMVVSALSPVAENGWLRCVQSTHKAL